MVCTHTCQARTKLWLFPAEAIKAVGTRHLDVLYVQDPEDTHGG